MESIWTVSLTVNKCKMYSVTSAVTLCWIMDDTHSKNFQFISLQAAHNKKVSSLLLQLSTQVLHQLHGLL